MNSKNLMHAIGILLLLLVGDWGIGTLLESSAKNRRYDDRIGKILNGSLQSNQIFILGESAASRNVNAEILTEGLSKESFNIGFPGSNLTFHEMMAEIILDQKDHDTEMIILTLNERGLLNNTKNDVGGLSFREDIANAYIGNNKVLEFLTKNTEKNVYLSKLSKTYRNNDNLNQALAWLISGTEKENRLNKVSPRGSMPLDSKSITFDTLSFDARGTDFNPLELDKKLESSLLNIIKRANQEQVKLLILLSPEYKKEANGFIPYLNSLPGEFSILDLRQSMLEKDLFYDKSHFDKKGSEQYSRLLVKEIEKYLND